MNNNEKKTIREHLAKQYAEYISKDIKERWNNGQSLYENEVHELVGILEKELLILNGYDNTCDDCEGKMTYHKGYGMHCPECWGNETPQN